MVWVRLGFIVLVGVWVGFWLFVLVGVRVLVGVIVGVTVGVGVSTKQSLQDVNAVMANISFWQQEQLPEEITVAQV